MRSNNNFPLVGKGYCNLSFYTWLMLHTTTEGKKTSERGTVIVSTVVTTVAFMKSIVLL